MAMVNSGLKGLKTIIIVFSGERVKLTDFLRNHHIFIFKTYLLLNPFSAGTDFGRQILTSEFDV